MSKQFQNIPTIRDQLSAKIVSYCKERCLHLDGMALHLESGSPLDADMCDAISAYCAVKCLTLGGLLAEVESLFAAYLAADKAASVGRYQALQIKLKAVEARTGLYLSDECVDLQNAGRDADDSTLYRVAVDAAAMRAQEAGFNINELLGEIVW